MASRQALQPQRHPGLRKTEFVCPRCGYTEVRYFPTRRRPSSNLIYCQGCPGTPTGTGEILVAYWLEGFGSNPANPLAELPPGIVVPPGPRSSLRANARF